MLNYIKQESNSAKTENGGAALVSTGSDCLDLFAAIGALRRQDEADIIARFVRAYAEDPDSAVKILFFARDVRCGLGERRVFRVILHWLACNEPKTVVKNLDHVAEFGRFDDLFSLIGTPCEQEMFGIINKQFCTDLKAMNEDRSVSLLAKWLPSVNASSDITRALGKKVARAFGLTDKQYRKALTALRSKIRIIENNLRERNYTFDYEKQPSRALFKYRAAFWRNDKDRYEKFLSDVSSGKAEFHADNVSPYELVEPYLTTGWSRTATSFMRDITPEEKAALNATWTSMPNFGGTENALAVIDTSGSMYAWRKPLPAAVALSLGLYFAEHNTGLFKDHFIEFSMRPQLIEIKGKTFADRLRYVASFNEIANTNMEAVFDLILSAAVKNHVPQEELPAKLILISDMEFDSCVENASLSIFENARQKYESFGYRLPQIVFWNVASRNGHQPVIKNEQGVALVSGVTPRLFTMVAGGITSPYVFMVEVLQSERYAKVAA